MYFNHPVSHLLAQLLNRGSWEERNWLAVEFYNPPSPHTRSDFIDLKKEEGKLLVYGKIECSVSGREHCGRSDLNLQLEIILVLSAGNSVKVPASSIPCSSLALRSSVHGRLSTLIHGG